MNGAAWRPLCFYSQAVGIVRRPETRAGRMTLAGDLHLYPRAFEPGRAHALVAAYPAEGHAASEGVPEGRRGDGARELAVAPDGLVAPGQELGIVEHEADQALGERLALPLEQGLAAEELAPLVKTYRPAEPRFERGVVGRQLPPPGAVALLEPQRVDGVVAGIHEPESIPRLAQRVVHVACELHRHVELPAQLSHVGDPRGADHGPADSDLPARGEREAGAGEVGRAHARQELPRARPHHPDDGIGAAHVGQGRAAVFGVTPAGANQFARSQPILLPKQAPRAWRRS